MQARTLNGRYRLDEIIGEGGMAVVYRGYDLVLNRDVAVKLLREQYGSDESFLIRFDREAQSAARLSHPHIVNVYDVGQDGNTRYIVMELVDGPNLKELIYRQGPFTAEGAAFIIRQIGDALDYAHARNLVHRDIKPQNILVDENGSAKVVDFGIAKGLSDATLTDAGTGMGTVHYVSPEQARGESATHLSDVYSTGIVLFEMLTRELPFDADTPVGVAMKHVSDPPPLPSDFNSQITRSVDDVVVATLAKMPGDRYASAGDMATALEQAVNGAGDQRTRVMPGAGTAAAGAAAAGAGPRPSRARGGGRRRGAPPPRGNDNFRDDVGCVTWLIGSAILIGLIGLVVLAFRLGDFGVFEPQDATPTQTEVAVETTETETITETETETETQIETDTPEPTEEETPEVTPTPTPEETETPEEVETARVPELRGATLTQAQQSAQVGDFELIDEEVFDEDIEEGRIISQSPSAGTELEVGSQIEVTVSAGSQFISLPNLAGQSRAAALDALSDLPVDVEEAEESNQSVSEGNVIRLEPAQRVEQGDTVTLVISRGDQVQIPDVFREPINSATQQLSAAGLTVSSAMPQSCQYITERNSNFNCNTFPDQGVVSATLPWDAWVPRGSTIDVGYYEADTTSQTAGNEDDEDDDDED